MDAKKLIVEYPRIFHMAAGEALPSIQTHGLLTTEQLVDLYGLPDMEKEEVLYCIRRSVVTLSGEGVRKVVIRDQKPMKFLEERIEVGSSLREYLAAINARVFFWPTRERLARLVRAKEYRGQSQVILHIDTAELLARHGHRVELCRFNSGAVSHKNHPFRGHRSWVPVSDYPYDEYRRRHGRDRSLAEVTVRGGVPDVIDLVVDIEHLEA